MNNVTNPATDMTVTLQLGYTPANMKIITKVVCLDEIPHLTETLIMKSCLLLYFIFKLLYISTVKRK